MMKNRIVIVDDNVDIRYTIAEICKLAEWTVLALENYREVEEFLRNGKAELFLVDYHLPEKDGIDIVKMIRDKDEDVPIIILTVEERENVMKKAIEAGADDYALKPIKAVDLISRIKVHLKNYEREQLVNDRVKGINQATLEQIYQVLKRNGEYMETSHISKQVEIADKSVYRYLKYMKSRGMLEERYSYSDKAGRPKVSYKLKGDQIK